MKCKDCKFWEKYSQLIEEGTCKNTSIKEFIEVATHDGLIPQSYVEYIDTNENFGCIFFEDNKNE